MVLHLKANFCKLIKFLSGTNGIKNVISWCRKNYYFWYEVIHAMNYIAYSMCKY